MTRVLVALVVFVTILSMLNAKLEEVQQAENQSVLSEHPDLEYANAFVLSLYGNV